MQASGDSDVGKATAITPLMKAVRAAGDDQTVLLSVVSHLRENFLNPLLKAFTPRRNTKGSGGGGGGGGGGGAATEEDLPRVVQRFTTANMRACALYCAL